MSDTEYEAPGSAAHSPRQPIDGGIYSWEPVTDGRLYTRKGAQRVADLRAKRSPIRGAVGIVTDTGRGYWRVSVGGQPHA